LPLRYDETFTSSKIGQAQRASVWRELARVFQPGDRTLEIDAAPQQTLVSGKAGVRVLACDSSSQMIASRRAAYKADFISWCNHFLRAEDITTLHDMIV
jgi:hypothetical protein